MSAKRAASGGGGLLLLVGSITAGCSDAPTPAETPALTLTPLASISPESVPFGRIVDIELGADGSLYVLDGFRRSVRVFDQNGLETGEFGTRGRGPGELEQPARLLWRPGGELWVLDPANARFTAFDASGDLLETYPVPNTGIVFPFAVGFASPTTLRAVGLASPDLSNLAAAWAEAELEGTEWVNRDSRDLPFVEWPETFTLESSEMVMVLPVPFSGEPQFEFDDSGSLWYATTAAPSVSSWSPAGGMTPTIVVDAPATAPTADEIETALADPDFDELRSLGEENVNRFSDMIPQTKPPIAGFFFGEEGQVWVVHGMELGQATRRHRLSIFDAERALVGTTELELTIVPRPRIRGGVLATVTRDDFGIESVQLHRVGR